MNVSDLWLLHRERILWCLGAILALASVVVIVTLDVGIKRNNYLTGILFGVATRNIVIGLVVGCVGAYLWRRFYWLDKSASWNRFTPESIAIAGVVALGLAVVSSVTTDTEGIDPLERYIIEGQACFDEGSPITALRPGSYGELSDRKAEYFHPEAKHASEDLRALQRHYVVGRGEKVLLVSFHAVGEDVWDPQFQEDFVEARRAGGLTVNISDLAGRETIEMMEKNQAIAIAAPVGCNLVTLKGRGPEETRALAEPIIQALDPA